MKQTAAKRKGGGVAAKTYLPLDIKWVVEVYTSNIANPAFFQKYKFAGLSTLEVPIVADEYQ